MASAKHRQPSTDKRTSNDVDQRCPICLETIDNRTYEGAVTTCGHLFCHVCLQRALGMNPFCPTCRLHQRRNERDLKEPEVLDEHIQWNPETVRAFFSREGVDSNGMRRVCLSNGEQTNIFIDPKVKLRVDPNVNLVINGKKLEDPSACNQP